MERRVFSTVRLGRAVRGVQLLHWAHPVLLTALKAACAAALAWLAVRPVGGFVSDYPYYAPLGAVVAMSTTVAGSLRYTLQSVLAIVVGGVLAMLTRALPIGDLGHLSGIAVVAGAGTLFSRWHRLGAMGGWVPIAGLFVLILGGSHPWHYVLAYGGLTAVGAVIGVALNAAVPQLPLTPATRALTDLRRSVAWQLDALAGGLVTSDGLSKERWEKVCAVLDPQARQVEELLRTGMEGRRGNWRASRWIPLVERRYEQGRVLRILVGCVEEVAAQVTDPDSAMHDDGSDGDALREATVNALRRTSMMILNSSEEDPEAGRPEREQAEEAVHDLRSTVAEHALRRDDQRGLDIVAMVVNLERAVTAWQ